MSAWQILALIVALWLIGALLYSLVTGALAVTLSTARGTPRSELVATLREVLVTLFLIPHYPVDVPRRRWASHPPSAEGRVVLLLPGYFETDAMFWRLRRFLRRAGLGYETARYALAGDPVVAAHKVRDRLEALAAERGVATIDLVGHSMGGMIGRYVADVLLSEHVGRVVCVASPHDGTRLGPLGLGAAARELSPGAAFVRTLAAAPPTRPTLNIWTRHDNVVIPRESSQRAAEDHELAGAWAHNGSIFAAETCEAIVTFLHEGLDEGLDEGLHESVPEGVPEGLNDAGPAPPHPPRAPASSSR